MRRFRGRRLLLAGEQPRPVDRVRKCGGICTIGATYLRKLPLVLLHQRGVDLDLRGRKSGRGNELERRVAVLSVSTPAFDTTSLYIPNELPSKPEEGFFEVVVRLRRDFEVLDVLLAVESDLAGLHFPLLETENDEDDQDNAGDTSEKVRRAPLRRPCYRKVRWGCSRKHAQDRGASWARSCT